MGPVPFWSGLISSLLWFKRNAFLRVERLRELGHELRRPVVVSHGITKERAVPKLEIERALERKRRFVTNPVKHGYAEEDTE